MLYVHGVSPIFSPEGVTQAVRIHEPIGLSIGDHVVLIEGVGALCGSGTHPSVRRESAVSIRKLPNESEGLAPISIPGSINPHIPRINCGRSILMARIWKPFSYRQRHGICVFRHQASCSIGTKRTGLKSRETSWPTINIILPAQLVWVHGL